MSDLNSYSFTGRLGTSAELLYTQSGSAVWKARIGVSYGYGDSKGTNWLNVSLFGKRAESLGKLNLAKGAHVGVAGELRLREYTAKNGETRLGAEVVANDIALLGKPEEKAEKRPERTRMEAPAPQFVDDAEIPF